MSYEYLPESKKILLAKLLAFSLKIGHLPSYDEIRDDPDMPDPNNDYVLAFGSLDTAKDLIRTKFEYLRNSEDDEDDEEENIEENTDTEEAPALEEVPSIPVEAPAEVESPQEKVSESYDSDEAYTDYEGDNFDEGPLFENEAASTEDDDDVLTKDPFPRETAAKEDDEEDTDDEEDDTKAYHIQSHTITDVRQPVAMGPTVKLLNYTRHQIKVSDSVTHKPNPMGSSGYVAVVQKLKCLFNYRAPINGIIYTSFQVLEETSKPMIAAANDIVIRGDNLIEFPAPRPDAILIVDKEVAEAAREYGRDIDDLIYIKEYEKNDDGTITVSLFARL